MVNVATSLELSLAMGTSDAMKALSEFSHQLGVATKNIRGLNGLIGKKSARLVRAAGNNAPTQVAAAGKGQPVVAVAIELVKAAAGPLQERLRSLEQSAPRNVVALNTLSAATGIGSERLQALRQVGSTKGLSFEEVDSAIRIFATNLGQASKDVESAIDVFKQLGIDKQELKTESIEQILDKSISAIAAKPEGLERTTASSSVFGQSAGASLGVALGGGPELLDEIESQLKNVGALMNDALVKRGAAAVEQYQEALTILEKIGQTNFIENFSAITAAFPDAERLGALKGTAAASGAFSGAVSNIGANILGGAGIATDFLGIGADSERVKEISGKINELNEEIANIEGVLENPDLDATQAAELGQELERVYSELGELLQELKALGSLPLPGPSNTGNGELGGGTAEPDHISFSPGTAGGILDGAAGSAVMAPDHGRRVALLAEENVQVVDLTAALPALTAKRLEAALAIAQQASASADLTGALDAELTADGDAAGARNTLAAAEETLAGAVGEGAVVQERMGAALTLTNVQMESLAALLPRVESGSDGAAAAQRRLNDAFVAGANAPELPICGDLPEKAKQVSDAARQMGASIAGAFEQAVLSGGSFSDLLEGLAGDLQRTLFRELVTDNLSSSISGFIQTGLGAILSGGAATGQSGGIIGTTPLPTRNLSVAAFAGAPHFAGGGIVGRQPRMPSSGEVAAVLHKGEMVLTRNDQAGLLGLIRGGGGGTRPVNLTVNMPAGTNARDARASAGQIGAEVARQLRLHDRRNN